MSNFILFRGKTLPNSNCSSLDSIWVEGDLLTSNAKYFIHLKSNTFDTIDGIPNCVILHEVIPDTVGQYTGFHDIYKCPIFEGDLVKFTDSTFNYSYVGTVCFHNGSFCILYDFIGMKYYHEIGKSTKWQDMGASGITYYTYEVVGNSCDNLFG